MIARTLALHLALGLITMASSSGATKGLEEPPAVMAERLIQWQHLQEIVGEGPGTTELVEVALTPETFDGARPDLADLRLFDAGEREVPYALELRRSRHDTEPMAAQIFNRSRGPGQSSLMSLDLGSSRLEHNEIEIALEGQDYRRRALVEGSDDGEGWSTIAEEDLLNFEVDGDRLVSQTLRYSPSRHQYLRLTVWPDPQVDQQPVEIRSVVVRRRVQLPSERVRHGLAVGERQPVRAAGGPGSSWTMDLGGREVPVSRLYVEVSDAELARDWTLEAGGPAEDGERFRWVASGTWRRRAGEPVEPLVAELDEVTAARLRLVVTDHRNPPLKIQRATAEADARVVVFPAHALAGSPLRLYSGNPRAEAPRYDFARNLPPRLEPRPLRLELGPRQRNPVFQPEPLPLTERWPGLIYLVLGLAVAALLLLILNLARTSFAQADRRTPTGPG